MKVGPTDAAPPGRTGSRCRLDLMEDTRLASPLPHEEESLEPDISHLVTEDDTPVDSPYSEKQMRLLTSTLYTSWKPQRDFVAMANVGLFAKAENPAVVPDVMLSLDVALPEDLFEKGNRSYMIWRYGKPPDLVIEVVSNRTKADAGAYSMPEVASHYHPDPEYHLGSPTSGYEPHGRRYVEMMDCPWLTNRLGWSCRPRALGPPGGEQDAGQLLPTEKTAHRADRVEGAQVGTDQAWKAQPIWNASRCAYANHWKERSWRSKSLAGSANRNSERGRNLVRCRERLRDHHFIGKWRPAPLFAPSQIFRDAAVGHLFGLHWVQHNALDHGRGHDINGVVVARGQKRFEEVEVFLQQTTIPSFEEGENYWDKDVSVHHVGTGIVALLPFGLIAIGTFQLRERSKKLLVQAF